MRKRSIISVPVILLGKFLRAILRLTHRGGSALPGRIIEVVDRNFLSRMCKLFKYGVVLVTGTNGKTTTTHIISQLLEAQGCRVFTNKTGSNFTRGIISELVHQASIFGNPHADVAVLELDEAYGVHFSKIVAPDVAIFLNVMRDQLDRFGELTYTTSLLKSIADTTKRSVILNREDPNLRDLVGRMKGDKKNPVRIMHFGLSEKLRPLFLNDDELYSGKIKTVDAVKTSVYATSDTANINDLVLFESFEKGQAEYLVNGHHVFIKNQLHGIHNAYNVAAAICAVQQTLGKNIDGTKLVSGLNGLGNAFGRGETIKYGDTEYDLVLVKNPAGFRIALQSFEPDSAPVMIAINDEYADGRDISWLYDVDFNVLKYKAKYKGAAVITGKRAYDLSLKFNYTDNQVKLTDTNIQPAFTAFTKMEGTRHKRIYATYTAMLELRALLHGTKGSTL